VDNKDNKQWVWLALDADTREIVGVYIGARSEAAARSLWDSLPGVYRQCAVAYTDFWAAYRAVLPSQRHRAVGKETGKTSLVERFNNTRKTSGVSVSALNLIVLEIVEQPHWCNLVFYSRLQRIITSVGLPSSLRTIEGVF